ncbi:hypothetical protein Cs7R123_60180 [Catellatospora sp. TT07R-123]|nr:hypothetical protein Cs7R123_60180 [Catellatospora sp. TT07R-123]
MRPESSISESAQRRAAVATCGRAMGETGTVTAPPSHPRAPRTNRTTAPRVRKGTFYHVSL